MLRMSTQRSAFCATRVGTRIIRSSVRNRNPSLSQVHGPATTTIVPPRFTSTQMRSFTTTTLLDIIPLDHPIKLTASIISFVTLLAALKYRGAIKRQLRLVREESWLFGAGVTMERVMDEDCKGMFCDLKLLELNPDFKKQYETKDLKIIGMSDYLSTLRPRGLPKKVSVDDMPELVQRELEAGLAAALLRGLGPNMGLALLPAVGSGFVHSAAKKLAAKFATDWFFSPNNGISESNDKAGVPIGVMTLLAGADLNAKLNSGGDDDDVDTSLVPDAEYSPIEKMMRGEVVKGLTFADESLDLVPQNFCMEAHFQKAIDEMEKLLEGSKDHGGLGSTEYKMAQEAVLDQQTDENKGEDTALLNHESYDPEDRRLAEPVPINSRLFPGLCLGYGDALCSHTKREVLKMRLLSVLLNKLGSNYYKKIHGQRDKIFRLGMTESDEPIETPWQLIEALIKAGHDIQVVPSSRLTTFGIGMCVKENDGSYSNIPLGVFLESGYEDAEGNMAPVMLPHSGLDVYIKGPLASVRADGTPSELAIQHFIGIGGFCGWNPNANPEIPYNEAVTTGSRLSGKDAVRAARIAGVYANVLNGLGTELALPFGGYGVTAVCNDSAAVIQQILYGKATIFPLTAIGRYAQRTMRYAHNLQEQLQQQDGMNLEVDDLRSITTAMRQLPSDINAAPSNAHSAAERLLQTMQPKLPFLLLQDSKRVMEKIVEEEVEAKKNMSSAGTNTKGTMTP